MERERPYADAPRLTPAPPGAKPHEDDGSPVDLHAVVRGEWLEVEIGPGRGGFVQERAAAEPRAAIVGFEVRRKWAAIVDGRLARAGLSARARVFAEDARLVLPRLVPDGSVRRFFVHFPDPWWKKRHAKRMVVGDVLLSEVARLLEPGGELFVQTDVEERAAAYEERVRATGLFDGGVVDENPYNARSPRERRAIADGLPIHRLLFRRR
jgi:tRNA (guanine-N7-)-methyltransferase